MLNTRLMMNNLYLALFFEDVSKNFSNKISESFINEEKFSNNKENMRDINSFNLLEIQNIYKKYINSALNSCYTEKDWLEVKSLFSHVENNDKEKAFFLLKEQDWYWEDDLGDVREVRWSEESLNNAFNYLRKIICEL